MPFWQFFRMGCDGRALVVWPSTIPQRNLENLFVLDTYESLGRLKGKMLVANVGGIFQVTFPGLAKKNLHVRFLSMDKVSLHFFNSIKI